MNVRTPVDESIEITSSSPPVIENIGTVSASGSSTPASSGSVIEIVPITVSFSSTFKVVESKIGLLSFQPVIVSQINGV